MNGKTLLILLAVLSIGTSGYILYRNTKYQEPTEETIVGNDVDEYGCKISAGYTWCEQKQKCLRMWEEACEDGVPVEAQAEIIPAITDALIAKHGQDAGNMTIEVRTVEGDYAMGSAHEEGLGGGMWFATRADGAWVLVWDGNGTIGCADIESYDFPPTIVPECYNEATGEMILR